MSKLQEQFERENNVNICDGSGKTFRLYIEWLENKYTEEIKRLGECIKKLEDASQKAGTSKLKFR